MQTSGPIGVWLAAAVGLHLAVASAAAVADVPQAVQFYGVVLAYAAPAALGLAATGRLTPWRATAFAVLVAAANALAVSAAFATAPHYGDSIWMLTRPGAVGGLIGGVLSLFGLVALGGGKPPRPALLRAAGFSAILAAMAGGLCVAMFAEGLPLTKALALPVVLYLPWQIVFSFAVARISSTAPWPSAAPARRGSRRPG
jgi:hypothetical protein